MTFTFSNWERSPPKGSYEAEPRTPFELPDSQITQIKLWSKNKRQFKTFANDRDYHNYCMGSTYYSNFEFCFMNGESISTDDKKWDHEQVIKFDAGETIVAARVDTYGDYPLRVALLVYDCL